MQKDSKKVRLNTPLISEFPVFKSISIRHKKSIEKFVSSFPPYSDYNYMSLLTWNTDNCILVSKLFGNLIIQFDDYISRKTYFSFLGTNKPVETCKQLIDEAKRKRIATVLKLAPEASVNSQELKKAFNVTEDRDDFDYVFDVKEMVHLRGNKMGPKRNFINRFKKNYKYNYRIINLNDHSLKKSILGLTKTWKHNKGKEALSTKFEFCAIKNAILYGNKLDIMTIGLFINNKLIGISINNLLPNNYAMNLFEKANVKYIGSFPFLRHITCKYLLETKRTWLNFESDIGVGGLRQSKLSYHPKFFLKKYIVEEKSD